MPASTIDDAHPLGARTLGGLRWSVGLLSLPFFVLGLLLPVYGRELGASVVQIGTFFTAFSAMTIVMRPLVGWLLDRFGRKWFFITGVFAYAASMLAFAAIDQVWGIVAARMIQGVASSFMWLSAYAMISDTAPGSQRGVAYGALQASSSSGSIIGTFLGFGVLMGTLRFNGRELLPEGDRWSALFLVYAAFTIAAALIALIRLQETRGAGERRVMRPIVWSRAWLLLLLVTLVTGASWAMVSPILIIFLQDNLKVGIETLAWVFLPSGLVWALLPGYLGRLADRFGRKPMMLVGLAGGVAISLLLPSLATMAGVAVAWAGAALCFAIGDPAEQALVSDLTGKDQRGRAYGLYIFASDLGAALGPLAGAWLYQTYSPAAPFYANAAVLLLCLVVLAFWLKVPAINLHRQAG